MASNNIIKNVLLVSSLVVFGIIMAVGSFEVLVRLFFVSDSISKWSDRPKYYFGDPQSSHLRDFKYSKSKPQDIYRIAVLGDSFSFATQMQFYDAYPKKLETILNLNKQQKQVQVINFGVPGYSTTHQVGAFKHIKEYQPDLILLQITLNDPQLKPYTPTGITGNNEFGTLNTENSLGGFYKYFKSISYLMTRIHNTQTHQRYQSYYHRLFEDNSKTFLSFKNALTTLSKKTRKKAIKLAAVSFPLFGLPLDNEYPFSSIHQKIDLLLTELKIPHLDLLNAFANIPLARIQLIPGQDFHPNELGHRIASEEIAEWLIHEKIVPQELAQLERYKQRLNILPAKNLPSM